MGHVVPAGGGGLAALFKARVTTMARNQRTTAARWKMTMAVVAMAGLLPQLGACTNAATVAGAGVSLASLTTTKKTLTDHVASAITGRDCSTISLSDTGEYCPEQVVVDRSNLYCFKTLAEVQCHTLPDPYKNGTTALASPPPIRKPVSQKGLLDPLLGQ